MLLYCPYCQNLIDKRKDCKDGEILCVDCQRCKKKVSFYIKHKAKSKRMA